MQFGCSGALSRTRDCTDTLIDMGLALYLPRRTVRHKVLKGRGEGFQKVGPGRALFKVPLTKFERVFAGIEFDPGDQLVSEENGQNVVSPSPLSFGHVYLPNVVK